MYAVLCPTHGTHVLLGPESIVAMTNDPSTGRIVVELRCHCGTELSVHTGRGSAASTHISPGAPSVG